MAVVIKQIKHGKRPKTPDEVLPMPEITPRRM